MAQRNDSTASRPFETNSNEPERFVKFREWVAKNDGFIHPLLSFVTEAENSGAFALDDIPSDTTVLSCPFQIAVTPEQASKAVVQFFAQNNAGHSSILGWNERMRICGYIIAHWIAVDAGIIDSTPILAHLPYLRTYPPPEALSTPLYFNEEEFELLKGTNLYTAVLTRKQELESEWQQCLASIRDCGSKHTEQFTWKRYLAATTYLSSRSFPSSLLSKAPTLSSSANPHPVLLPIIDVLNHARGHPVSWSVNDSPQGLQFSVIQHKSIPKGFQVLNNYGPKPNNELLLGYGFVLPDNPNDTTILKIGGSQKSWEVGKTGDEALLGLWEEILDRLNGGRVAEQDDTPAWETQLEAADVLSEMTQAQISRLPDVSRIKDKDVVREQVRKMIEVYVEGQRQILDRIGSFAESQRQAAIQAAKDDGIDLVFDESDG